MDVKRVAGRLHLSVHQNMVFQMLPQLLGDHHIPNIINMSHVIHHLGFGPKYPGRLDPLDGYVRMVGKEPFSYKYFLKVVPTEYYSRTGEGGAEGVGGRGRGRLPAAGPWPCPPGRPHMTRTCGWVHGHAVDGASSPSQPAGCSHRQ